MLTPFPATLHIHIMCALYSMYIYWIVPNAYTQSQHNAYAHLQFHSVVLDSKVTTDRSSLKRKGL